MSVDTYIILIIITAAGTGGVYMSRQHLEVTHWLLASSDSATPICSLDVCSKGLPEVGSDGFPSAQPDTRPTIPRSTTIRPKFF